MVDDPLIKQNRVKLIDVMIKNSRYSPLLDKLWLDILSQLHYTRNSKTNKILILENVIENTAIEEKQSIPSD